MYNNIVNEYIYIYVKHRRKKKEIEKNENKRGHEGKFRNHKKIQK